MNADDAYIPGAVETGVRALSESSGVVLVYGEGDVLDESGAFLRQFEGTEPVCLWRLVNFLDYILQPTTFFEREVFEAVGGLREDLQYGLDWDLWTRIAAEKDLLFVPAKLAVTREYEKTKTGSGGWPRVRELGSIAAAHSAPCRRSMCGSQACRRPRGLGPVGVGAVALRAEEG